jgi:nitroreductase
MTLLTETRRATTAAPIHELLADRWSPRSFDPEATVSEEQIAALLEAARWAPSAANFQPRRFLVARRGSASFDRITEALSSGNQPWAPAASLYVVAVALAADPEGTPYRWAEYDAGQAIAGLAVQAHALGLHVHPMGGFDPEAIRREFALPEGAVPVTVNAIGTVAAADRLPERYRSRETAERTRLPLSELVLVDD